MPERRCGNGVTIYESRAVEYAKACVEPDNRLVPRYVKKHSIKSADFLLCTIT